MLAVSTLLFGPSIIAFICIYITIKVTSTPSFKTLRLLNIASGIIHLGLAIIQLTDNKKLEEGDLVEVRDGNDYKGGEFIKFNVDNLAIIKETKYLDQPNASNDASSNTIEAQAVQADIGDEILIDGIKFIKVENTSTSTFVKGKTKLTREYAVNKKDIVFGGWELRAYQEQTPDTPEDGFTSFVKPIKKNVFGKWLTLRRSCAVFSALTAMHHFGYVLLENKYKKILKQKNNPFRWIEYFITSGIMMVNLANVNDITEFNDVLSVFVLTAITNIFGSMCETAKSTSSKFAFFGVGFIPFIVPWYFIYRRYKFFESILLNFKETPNNEKFLKTAKEQINNLKLLGGVIFSLYNVFPAIQATQILLAHKYRSGEAAFCVASLLAKTALNTGIYMLSRRPNFTHDG
uniref:Uncharacterized protein n=1 Tax=Megaviridae environmental sample TaxID=1737588 RepID=A0A5J6VJ38_9VIRU|nr:MAG: hypothetical protein [Megaviridae environmental sample]